tara:strand:- start:25 stop:858 length:834 start_codon:yes stop_codon:yes gene_type:complete
VLKQMLEKYQLSSEVEVDQAWREIMQEIALAGLYRGGFFEKAAFYGGTCLRIFYGLPRFSEDLDFSLLVPDKKFSLEPYFKAVKNEFMALGIDVEITQKNQKSISQIESAFLKSHNHVFDIKLQAARPVKIKFEVDTDPPLGFATEEKLLLEPFSFYVKCFQLPDLFAGKLHALLFRPWQNRVKGRDWFDFEWYVRRGTPLHLMHFIHRARQHGIAGDAGLNMEGLIHLLESKIRQLNIENAKQDIIRFIPDPESLNIWSTDYFIQLTEKIKFLDGH